mmetsp:Transcript_30059/g.75514  ORF Transcript_30059/g.75514 Transcript_30059/m.75514 type:complete len:227 (-) Transcript_30059:1003-1683(-)
MRCIYRRALARGGRGAALQPQRRAPPPRRRAGRNARCSTRRAPFRRRIANVVQGALPVGHCAQRTGRKPRERAGHAGHARRRAACAAGAARTVARRVARGRGRLRARRQPRRRPERRLCLDGCTAHRLARYARARSCARRVHAPAANRGGGGGQRAGAGPRRGRGGGCRARADRRRVPRRGGVRAVRGAAALALRPAVWARPLPLLPLACTRPGLRRAGQVPAVPA